MRGERLYVRLYQRTQRIALEKALRKQHLQNGCIRGMVTYALT